MADYKQTALTLEEQIQLLLSKGLIINDINNAQFWLSQVSYFRLKNYTYTFKDYPTGGNGDFIPNTTFEQIIDLYLFDKELKLIIFDAIETIEVALKTQILNIMAPKYGSHWYLDKSFFSGAFEYDKFIENVAERCKDPDELFIEYYNKIYDVPPLPPSWMIMEIITFSKISLIFEHLAARQEKLQVCSNFGLPENILLSWFRCFNFIRNKCAHHNRIVYTAIKFQPVMPSRRKHKFLAESELISPNLIYCSLCCMQFLIRSINPKSKFSENILKLIKDNPQINLPSIGFTPKWHEEDIWN